MTVSLVNANSLRIPLADESVHCCVTSPPYLGLRDYGISGQLGLEATVDEYIADMVAVFREVWRVLRPDSTLWLNLGDSYASAAACDRRSVIGQGSPDEKCTRPNRLNGGLKEKDLMGIPWRVALALQADGWWLRSDIIWAKPNPMPESVTDRPTKAHEYLFLLAKSDRYYFDQDAVREKAVDTGGGPFSQKYADAQPRHGGESQYRKQDEVGKRQYTGFNERWDNRDEPLTTRNIRTVWTIPTEPTLFAHFATYPRKLVEPCILAGTSARGVCSVCGKPWVRMVEHGLLNTNDARPDNGMPGRTGNGLTRRRAGDPTTITTGWLPTCQHNAPTRPAVVFDPFAGSGTTGIVARQHGRSFVGFDLSMPYLHDIARKRLELDALDAWTEGITANDDGFHDLPLFTEAR